MVNQLTCVLEDGSRVYLKRAVSRDIHNKEILNGRGETYTGGNLLSKSMDELLKEAQDLKIASLANLAQREDKLTRELNASLGDLEGDGDLLIHEMQNDVEEMERLEKEEEGGDTAGGQGEAAWMKIQLG